MAFHEQVDALLAAGRTGEAVAVAERAAAAGDGEALTLLATWRLVGNPLPRDLPAARALLARARALGHRGAAQMEIALTGNGSGADGPDWAGALALLRAAAEGEPAARAQAALLDAMALHGDGSPARLPSPEPLAPNGAVQRFPGFLSPAECGHVARAASGLLEPAVVVDPATGRQVRHPHRTSDGAVLGPTREDPVVRAINLRIAAASGTHVDQGEALTILRYVPGQQYRPHHDSLPGTRNQRVKTMLLYLNEGFGGGETTFPAYKLSIRPRGGDAVLFTNTRADGRPDPAALHAGEPVTQGAKWLATRWIRARPFSLWTGPEVA